MLWAPLRSPVRDPQEGRRGAQSQEVTAANHLKQQLLINFTKKKKKECLWLTLQLEMPLRLHQATPRVLLGPDLGQVHCLLTIVTVTEDIQLGSCLKRVPGQRL